MKYINPKVEGLPRRRKVFESTDRNALKDYFDFALTPERGWRTDGKGTYICKRKGSIHLFSGYLQLVDPYGQQAEVEFKDIFDYEVDTTPASTIIRIRVEDSNFYWYF